MAYITFDQYIDYYGTCPIAEDEFPVYAGLASDIIDNATQYRIIQGGGISALPALVQTLVQKAAAAQVLYFTQVGLETVLTGQAGQSFTVGKVSVNGGGLSNQANKKIGSLMICPMALAYLEQTPLMERRVDVCYPAYRGPYWWM